MNRKNLLIMALALCAVFNFAKWGWQFLQSDYRPLDFRTYYVSSSTYFQDKNPYSDSENKATWERVRTDTSWNNTGFPHATVVYAPQFVAFFYFYNQIPFDAAVRLQFVLNALSLLAICYLIHILNRSISLLMIFGFIMAFRGTWYAFDNGQPMLQILAVCLFALYLIQKKNIQIAPGILLGFFAFKFTLILPFCVYLFYTKKYIAFSFLILSALCVNLVVIGSYSDPSTLIDAWQNNMQALYAYPHEHETLNAISIISTSVSVPIYYLFQLSFSVLKISMLFCFGISLLALCFFKGDKTTYFVLFASALSSLCFGQHLFYDILAVLAFRLLIVKLNEKPSNLEYILIVLLIAPIGSISSLLHFHALHLAVPIFLFIYYTLKVFAYFFKKNSAIKNPS